MVPDPMAERLSLIRTHLDQRAWRLLLGAEAKVLGRGGIKTVAAATGVHPDTVAQGVRALDYPEPIPGRIRRPGAGRSAVDGSTVNLPCSDGTRAVSIDAGGQSSRGATCTTTICGYLLPHGPVSTFAVHNAARSGLTW
jgi:hypothetical protein